MSETVLTTTAPVAFAFDSHAVRTITEEDGAIWFVARDVCAILGMTNPNNAFARLDEDQKGIRTMDTLGGPQELTVVNESGLYALVLTSRKTEAKQFARWVTGEVLPAIRRQGYYGGGALAKIAESATRTQALIESLAERQARQDEKIDAILTLVDVAGKYIALLEEGRRRPRKPTVPVTAERYERIRELLAQGMNGQDIADLMETSRATVSLIKNGRWTPPLAQRGAA